MEAASAAVGAVAAATTQPQATATSSSTFSQPNQSAEVDFATTSQTSARATTAGGNGSTPTAETAAPSATSSALVGTTCMELALEGERLCKTGELKNGVRFFEEAIKVGTNDDRTLSAIYSQLGNAYFYMEDYNRALEYHKLDVTLVHSVGDEVAEAKACGNLGNTYKMLGKFDEAAVYCRRYLEISRKLNDKVGEGRALYNLGNVYHTQGKRMIGASEQEPNELSNDIRSSLERAIEYYRMNLDVVTELNDQASMGRAYGNLGNTHYLLGDFEQAVASHKKRLALARQTNDKSAERRAHLNLGNANVFLGNFQDAIDNYTATYRLAQELQDKYTEAHSCYSLANTYTFLRDYKSAISYHLRYLDMIKEFDDKLGEGRACWSLVNIYQMVNDPESALSYAKRHHEIAEQLRDKAGLASAKLNIEELEEIISQKQAAQIACVGGQSIHGPGSGSHQGKGMQAFRLTPDKRQEQEQRRFKRQLNSTLAADIDGLAARRKGRGSHDRGNLVRSTSSEKLFDMIAHFQSGRIDDQRCEMLMRHNIITNPKTAPKVADSNKENLARGNSSDTGGSTEANVKTSSAIQSQAMNSKRASQPSIANPINVAASAAASAIKATYRKASLAYPITTTPTALQLQRRPTVSVEHREQLFDLIAGAQGQRMDEQRASLPAFSTANGAAAAAAAAAAPTWNSNSGHGLTRGHTIDQSATSSRLFVSGVSQRACNAGSAPAVPEPIQELNMENISQQHHYTQETQAKLARPPKLNRQFQTVDSSSHVHDEKFLDSLMKYQSTRFNDQRSEFPKKNSDQTADGAQTSDFLNLIVRFQSDRIDDQRSAPPARNREL